MWMVRSQDVTLVKNPEEEATQLCVCVFKITFVWQMKEEFILTKKNNLYSVI